jgi:hypothetical protein
VVELGERDGGTARDQEADAKPDECRVAQSVNVAASD